MRHFPGGQRHTEKGFCPLDDQRALIPVVCHRRRKCQLRGLVADNDCKHFLHLRGDHVLDIDVRIISARQLHQLQGFRDQVAQAQSPALVVVDTCIRTQQRRSGAWASRK